MSNQNENGVEVLTNHPDPIFYKNADQIGVTNGHLFIYKPDGATMAIHAPEHWRRAEVK